MCRERKQERLDQNMDNQKMAAFIATLRKEKALTQKELAAQLGVTDKAVSKWERGLSCPDISLLPTLCSILGITTGELLNGERENAVAPAVGTIVETTLQYADTVTKSQAKNVRVAVGVVLSATLLLAIIVCAICNLAITGAITWAWFPISSIVFGWLVTMPLILAGKRWAVLALTLLSLSIIPYLFVLEKIIGVHNLIVPMGARISIVALVYMWLCYLLITKIRLKKYTVTALLLLAAIPTAACINGIVASFVTQPPVNIWSMLGYGIVASTAIFAFAFGYLWSKR